MAPATANEVLILFSQALSSPSDSEQQASILAQVKEAIEADPAYIPVLYSTILSLSTKAGHLLKRWIADIVEFVVARLIILASPISPEQRAHLTVQSIDAILLFLETQDDPATQKLGLQCFATSYPLVFRHACGTGSDPRLWEKATRAKAIALNVWRSGHTGARIAAMRVVQKVIQSQTRGSVDPRLQNRGDVNLAMCPSHHPFMKPAQLEGEANNLLTESTTTLYNSNTPDIISSIINSFSTLVKARPSLGNVIIGALTNWAPNAIAFLSSTQIRSVEKTLRLALVHLLRSGQVNAFAAQINDSLHRQEQRMRTAIDADRRKKEEEASLKRQRISEEAYGGGYGTPDYAAANAKRIRLQENMGATGTPPPSSSAAVTQSGLADFDIKMLKPELVLELIIANLQVMTPERVQAAVESARANLADPTNPVTKSIEAACRWTIDEGAAQQTAQEEAIAQDPLKMELDEDDLEGRARDAQAREKQDKADLAAAEAEADATASAAGRLRGESERRTATPEPAQPQVLSGRLKTKLLHTAVGRICAVGLSTSATVRASGGDQDLWIQLITRLVTRGLDGDVQDAERPEVPSLKLEKDSIRKQMFDFVTADMGERIELARLWLNEEWFADSGNGEEPTAYEVWLRQILDFITTRSMDKEKGAAFTQFLVDLPEIPKAEMNRVAKMCTDPSGVKIGFVTLRDLAMLRPPLRQNAMDVLLALTTHADRPTRNTAILTIKRWLPDVQPLATMGQEFALHLLSRLETLPTPSASRQGSTAPVDGTQTLQEGSMAPPSEDVKPSIAEVDEDEKIQASVVAVVENGKVVGGLPIPATDAQVAQHIELLLGLVSKAPNLLEDLFKAYPRMSQSTKEAVQNLFTPLIRSLGPSHPKIASLIRDYPEGSEELALRILTIFTDKGKLPGVLSSLIKKISQEKELRPRFVIPIIADLDKAEITRHLPRILSLLNGQQTEKELIRSVLQSVVTTPPQSFGHVSTNVVRVRQSELLTPVELLVLIHLSEKEIGIKQSIEAVGICFSMTEAFRPEVLGAFMQQIVDETTLPTLFLRTVIQAVTTYKSLQPYVSNTLLSRLITKKIWTMPQLWQGFIRCAKVIAPHSYGAILQLPRDQIKEVVTKQPELKEGLKEYVLKRAGTNKTRIQGILEVLEGTGSPAPA